MRGTLKCDTVSRVFDHTVEAVLRMLMPVVRRSGTVSDANYSGANDRTCLLWPCDIVRVFFIWRQSIRRVINSVCKAVQRRILEAIVVPYGVTGGRCNCVDSGIGSRIRENQRSR